MLSLAIFLASGALAQNWSTYPSVVKTATINGFADPVYSNVPSCAQQCLTENESTDSTPCPYWDTGCLCMMSQFEGPIAECVASACQGSDVAVFTNAATSVCSSAGVNSPYWYIPSSASGALAAAATATSEAPVTNSETPSAVASATTAAVASSTAASEIASSLAAPKSSTPQSSIPEANAAVKSSAGGTSAIESTAAAESTAVGTSATESTAVVGHTSAAGSSSSATVVQTPSSNSTTSTIQQTNSGAVLSSSVSVAALCFIGALFAF